MIYNVNLLNIFTFLEIPLLVPHCWSKDLDASCAVGGSIIQTKPEGDYWSYGVKNMLTLSQVSPSFQFFTEDKWTQSYQRLWYGFNVQLLMFTDLKSLWRQETGEAGFSVILFSLASKCINGRTDRIGFELEEMFEYHTTPSGHKCLQINMCLSILFLNIAMYLNWIWHF